jgi:serine/threonine-protein kinase TTK/MPS1
MFHSRSDSDDDENSFKPPALSNYALALLQKEKTVNDNMNTVQSQQVPKRVNFRNSPESSISSKARRGDDYVPRSNSIHKNQSDHETLFTKSTPTDFDSYATSSSVNEKTQKTPLNRSSNSGLGTGSGGHTRLRSSARRARGFSGLGPPKRTSSNIEDVKTAPQDDTIEDMPIRDPSRSKEVIQSTIPTYETPKKKETKLEHTPLKRIDFGGLNPYQYLKKYNVPSTDLPKLVKIYFEQQKNVTKEKKYLESPIRLKEVMQNKIQEGLKYETNVSPRPQQLKADPPSSRDYCYLDKENHSLPQKLLLNSIERGRPNRQPLAPLSETKQQQLQNRQRPPSHNQPREDYYEHHYEQIEPLKAADESRKSSKLLTINGKQYEKLELLGKGGSSKVFKVKSLSNKVYAIKKISFDEFDEVSINGFKGEIELLNKLRDKERVVRMVDYALGQGSLMLVMECGDIDLCHVLAKRLDFPLDVEFVRFHANEVLKCVKAVHDAGIVHSDLKPANFLFVKGVLKIIDFGIANAVPEHTMNIYRESQIGTPNYMAPEALIDNNQHLADSTSHKSQWRVGKPSDIWSCGCIIYQMIYGRPPYGGYQGSQRLLAIMNPDVKISYPDKGLGGVRVPGTAIETIKACLMRDPSKRWIVREVLEGPFLKPRIVSEQFVSDLVKNAITYGVSKSDIGDEELKTLADDVWKRVSQLSL